MEALIYGVIDNENIVAFESAPPVIILRYSRKFPPVADLSIHSLTTDVSRNGTVMTLPILKIMMINRV